MDVNMLNTVQFTLEHCFGCQYAEHSTIHISEHCFGCQYAEHSTIHISEVIAPIGFQVNIMPVCFYHKIPFVFSAGLFYFIVVAQSRQLF